MPGFQRSAEYPVTITTKDGEIRRIEMTITGIMDGSVMKGVIASFRDMTEHEALTARARELTSFSGIIGRDKEMLHLFQQIRDVAPYDYSVCIHGETGTGKERVATALHNESKRAGALFVPVNCGAIPEGLVESELFGHVKGAFSGAVKERKGRCELAHKGTLFLDEVAELPKQIQVKLLRFLQEGTFERVGGETSIKVNARIISATNKKLAEEVKKGNFRKDLYYRLNVIPIELPPLSRRRNDIPLFISHFLEMAKRDNNNEVPEFSREAVSVMMDYSWPGNVRELQNAVQFAIVRCKHGKILPSDLPMELRNMVSEGKIEHVPPTVENPVADAVIAGPGAVSAAGAGTASAVDAGAVTDNAAGLVAGTAASAVAGTAADNSKPQAKLNADSVKKALEITGGNKAKAARYLGVGRATLYRFLNRYPEAADIEAYHH